MFRRCSQVIAAVGQEKLGKGNDEVIRAMGGFGGGLCGNGEVCGALAGALAGSILQLQPYMGSLPMINGLVTIVLGGLGSIPGAVIVGPTRSRTQVEVSYSNAAALGIEPPLRESGHLEGSPGAVLVGTAGEVALEAAGSRASLDARRKGG